MGWARIRLVVSLDPMRFTFLIYVAQSGYRSTTHKEMQKEWRHHRLTFMINGQEDCWRLKDLVWARSAATGRLR
jgi:hypothetical protein